jgi:hypothetical protein
MKKTISLFTVLAIVLAMGSAFAFKTKARPFTPDTVERFGVINGQANSSSTGPYVYSQKISDDFRSVIFGWDIDAEIASYNSVHSPGVTCSGTVSTICAAIVFYESFNPNTNYFLVDWNQGNYSL